MLRVIAVLLLIPLLDIMLLVAVAAVFGPVLTVLAVVLTALIGLLLVRAEGRHTLRKIQAKTTQGELPTNELVDGGLLLVAGALMLTPGLVTDLVGLLIVVPFTRYPIRLGVKKFVIKPYADAKADGFVTGNVYVGGFPGGENADAAGERRGPGAGSGGSGGGQSGPQGFDVDDDEVHDVDFDDEDEGR
jgi:UPF0716 protein FxsA